MLAFCLLFGAAMFVCGIELARWRGQPSYIQQVEC